MAMVPARQSTPEFEAAVRAIESIGGDVALTAEDGTFSLELQIPARFRVLVITRQPDRRAEVPRADLAKIGQLFVPAYDLVAGRIYSLQDVYVDRNACLELSLPSR